MSCFKRLTKHPKTGKWERADWIDNYFGHYYYAVKFPNDDTYYDVRKIDFETKETPIKDRIKVSPEATKDLTHQASTGYSYDLDWRESLRAIGFGNKVVIVGAKRVELYDYIADNFVPKKEVDRQNAMVLATNQATVEETRTATLGEVITKAEKLKNPKWDNTHGYNLALENLIKELRSTK